MYATRFLSVLVLLSISSVNVQASTSSLPSWASGDLNCKIDGRPARMNWRVVDDPQTECDGNVCSTTSAVKTVGNFSDNGGGWVPLGMTGVTNGGLTLNIRYLGAEQDNWQLTQNNYTEVATGWTTWRGNRYPLSCWKGDVPLPDRCASYATEAVQQFQSAQQQNCGINPDARWHADYNAHYGWCMQAKGRSDWLTAESQARKNTLNQCFRMNNMIRIQPDVDVLRHLPTQ